MKQNKTYILRTPETSQGCWIDKTEATSITNARKIFATRNTGKYQIVEYGNTDIFSVPQTKTVRL